MGGINRVLEHHSNIPCAAQISLQASSLSTTVQIVEGELPILTKACDVLHTSHLKLDPREGKKEVKVLLSVDGLLSLSTQSSQIQNEAIQRNEKGKACQKNDKIYHKHEELKAKHKKLFENLVAEKKRKAMSIFPSTDPLLVLCNKAEEGVSLKDLGIE